MLEHNNLIHFSFAKQSEPHGLDEALVRNSFLMKDDSNRLSVNTTSSSNPSSCHSPSVAGGDQFDVKVEITPPQPISTDPSMNAIPKSISNESSSAFSISITEYQAAAAKTPSPQNRKQSDIQEYSSLLSAMGSITRMNPSPTGSNASSRFFKKIEEMIDLSSPYNHYKCLSPSETNLTQFGDARMAAFTQRNDPNKPGSGRLLRRQFSLDKGKWLFFVFNCSTV